LEAARRVGRERAAEQIRPCAWWGKNRKVKARQVEELPE